MKYTKHPPTNIVTRKTGIDHGATRRLAVAGAIAFDIREGSKPVNGGASCCTRETP